MLAGEAFTTMVYGLDAVSNDTVGVNVPMPEIVPLTTQLGPEPEEHPESPVGQLPAREKLLVLHPLSVMV